MISNHIALYFRSATGDQNDLDRQDRALRKFVNKTVGFIGSSVAIYCDSRQSGRGFGPELLRLTEDLRNGVYDGVVVTKLNRLSRNGRDLSSFYDLVRAKGFRFISLNENVDSHYWPSASGEMRGEG